MTSEHLQIERKYEVATDLRLPDLTRLPKVVAVDQVLQSTLDAVYSDTDDLALANAGITLRRRTGGSDAGWHLKLPGGGDDRSEVGEPLKDDDGVPPELLGHIRAWVRDRELRPVATLSTRRVVHRLVGAGGKVLAEVSDDVVTAHATPASGEVVASTWREWEIELVDGSRRMLAAADQLLREAGAAPSKWSSKLHHALGRHPDPAAAGSELTAKSSAGAAVHTYLAEQVQVMVNRDGDLRRSEPDAVHKVRVATRRLRSVLSTFRAMFDRSVTDPLREELSWLARSVGAVRDVEVQRLSLLEAVAAEPDDLVMGGVRGRIEVEMQSDYRAAHDHLLLDLDSARYFRLLDRLDDVVSAPPFTELAWRKGRTVLEKRLRHACARLYTLASADEPPAGTGRDEWLHEIRKAAKRVRYAAELAGPVLGKKARALAAEAEQMQESLGMHQDSVVVRATLRGIAVRMHLDGENSFSVGRLHALEQAGTQASEAAFRRAWSKRYAADLKGWKAR